jgi:hypothetical protein
MASPEEKKDLVTDSVSENRKNFLSNAATNIQGCLLIQTGTGLLPSYREVCAGNVNDLMSRILNELRLAGYDTSGIDAKQLQNMLLGGTALDEGAPFNPDTDTKMYFKLVVSPETKIKKNGAEVSMLDALRKTYAQSPIVKANTLPFLTDLGKRLLQWVYDKKLALAVAVMVLGIVYILLSDDPSSYLPSDVHRYFSTNSTSKKIVDAGQYWHKNYGEGRSEEDPRAPREQEEESFLKKEERKKFDRDSLFARALGKTPKPKLEGLAALQDFTQ